MRKFLSNAVKLSATGLLTIALAVALLAPAPAQAYGGRGWHHGGGYYGGWGLGLGLGLGFLAADAAFYNGYYPYGRYGYGYGYDYAPVYPVTPSVTVVQTTQAPAAVPSYYYCPNPKGYYPNVMTCQTPWQAVPVTPAGVH